MSSDVKQINKKPCNCTQLPTTTINIMMKPYVFYQGVQTTVTVKLNSLMIFAILPFSCCVLPLLLAFN